MAKRIPVLVVEDNRLVRDGIIAMLAEHSDLKVVAAVDSAPAAAERAREMKPDVVLVDAALGDHDSHRLVVEIKDAALDDFVSTVRAVASGMDVLPVGLTRTLFSHIAKLALGRKQAELIGSVRMTERERAVFDLIADGLSNKEIAQRLHLATNTVKGHVHNILEKLALHTRLQVAAYARSRSTSDPRRPNPN